MKTERDHKRASHLRRLGPRTEAALMAFIATTLIFFSTYLLHKKSVASLEEEIKIGLKSNVEAAATTIDGDAHVLFNASTDPEDSLYTVKKAPLEAIRLGAKDIRYIYTNILDQDTVRFVINPSPQNDGAMPPQLMDVYHDPSEALVEALTYQRVTVSEVYKDQWGTFISAYAPFKNSKGEFIGTLGMDLELDNFYKRLEPINVAFEKTVIIILFIGLVIGLFIWYIRKHTESLLWKQELSDVKLQGVKEHLKETYLENIALLTKIEKTIAQRNQTYTFLPVKFQSWIQHVIDYQRSKIDLEKPSLTDFALYDFVEELKRNTEELVIQINNKINTELLLCGAPLPLYVDSVVRLIHFVGKESNGKAIHLNMNQISEGIHHEVLQIEICISGNESFEGKMRAVLHPKITASNLEFDDAKFNMFIAIKELEQYECTVDSFSNKSFSGLRIQLKLFKSKES